MRGPVVALSLLAAALSGCIEDVEVIDTGDTTSPADRSHAADLWAADPLRQTLDLRTGDYGLFIQDGELRNRQSHLGFGLPNPSFVEVGIQGQETGVLIDLGTDADLAVALGAQNGFVGLSRGEGGRFGYGPADALFDRLQAIEEGQDGGDASRVVPEIGHVLVGAVVKKAGSAAAVDDALIVKILVVDHRPDTFLAMRWTVL